MFSKYIYRRSATVARTVTLRNAMKARFVSSCPVGYASILSRSCTFTLPVYDACQGSQIKSHFTTDQRNGSQSNREYSSKSRGIGLISVTVTLGGLCLYFLKTKIQEASKTLFPLCKCEEEQRKTRNAFDDERLSLEDVIRKSKDILERIKDETGSPGIAVSVSIDGKDAWHYGLGYADVENRLPCSADTVWRIASISKPITLAALGQQWEAGKIDLDKPVQHYLPKFPQKKADGKDVVITTRQLVSHLGGIRHYSKDYMKKSTENKTEDDSKKDKKDVKENKEKKKTPVTSEVYPSEYYIKEKYDSVTESLKLFENDPLVHEPGTKFLYTTHGFTLLSAVLEAASGVKFEVLVKNMFAEMGLKHTYLDENDVIIYNRGRHYVKNDKGRLVNAPYVDNSYKWAGGGYISTTKDIMKFGNIMLYSSQYHPCSTTQGQASKHVDKGSKQAANALEKSTDAVPGYLKKETVEMLWTPVGITKSGLFEYYGMGWFVVPESYNYGVCQRNQLTVSHTGGAIGASSILTILPRNSAQSPEGNIDNSKNTIPRGIVVAIVANISSVDLRKTAGEIADLFDRI